MKAATMAGRKFDVATNYAQVFLSYTPPPQQSSRARDSKTHRRSG